MTCIHRHKINKRAECNLLYDILNTPKRTKSLYSHYSTILQGCINTRKGKLKFKNFWVPLDSGCSSTIVMVRLIKR